MPKKENERALPPRSQFIYPRTLATYRTKSFRAFHSSRSMITVYYIFKIVEKPLYKQKPPDHTSKKAHIHMNTSCKERRSGGIEPLRVSSSTDLKSALRTTQDQPGE